MLKVGLGPPAPCRSNIGARQVYQQTLYQFLRQWPGFFKQLDELPARHYGRERHSQPPLHHCEVLVLHGDSYRLREAKVNQSPADRS